MTGDDENTFLNIEGLGILSRNAFMLHGFATIDSYQQGHPGFVSDDYLNSIRPDTTSLAAELEAAGMWERCEDGYNLIERSTLDHVIEFHERQDRLAAQCAKRGKHLPGKENGGWVYCRRCNQPLKRPDDGPVAT